MKIYKSGSEKWKADFFNHVDKANFPKYYGGEMVDENGDSKCQSKVCWGGKVPEELYTKQNDDNASNKSFQEGVVNKGQKLKVELETKDEENQILAWEFRTFDYDIKFGIYSLDIKTGEKTSEVHLGNVHSHEMDEIGFISCRPQTKCKYFRVIPNVPQFKLFLKSHPQMLSSLTIPEAICATKRSGITWI